MIKYVLLASTIHFILLILFSFLALGATMGLGFKDELTTFDEVFKFFAINGLRVVAGLGWYFSELVFKTNMIVQWIFIILNSLLHGALFVFIFSKIFIKRTLNNK